MVALKKHYPELQIHALVRKLTHLEKVRSAGATPIQGSFRDEQLIEEQAYEADIVINAADSDDVALTEAILRGLKRRHEAGRAKGTLIHTSGVAVFLDSEKEGKRDPNGKIWNVCLLFRSRSKRASSSRI